VHHYLKKLVDERNSLTGLIQQLNDKAVSEDRQLSDAEAERQRGWQERCAELDPLIGEQNDYLSQQRAWAKLQDDLSKNDANELQPVNRSGMSTALATRQPGGALVRQGGWGEAFTSSPVLQNYDGHGTSGVVVVGSVLDERAPIDTSFIDTPPSIFAATPWKMTTPLLDAIGRESVTSGNVEWVIWPGTYPLAAVVAEGALKPEATFAPTVRSGSLDTIAHDKGITRQALEDIPRIQQIVEGALRGGVLAKLEALAADALTTDATIATVENDDLMAGIRVALGNVQANGYASANAVLLNPADFADLDIAVMGATVAGPQLQNSFWGLRAIAAAAIPPGTAYVGDFKTGVTLFERGSTSLYVTDSHADYFLRNILVILAETRALAVVTEPLAIQKVTGVTGP
jgi:hypothetical protein